MTVEKTIIVVEDEQEAAEMFGEMMRVSGYHVLTAFGSEAAMAMIEKGPPDAVILDIMMPEVSGLAVLEFVHNDPRLANIPVVVVSAQGTPADIKTCLDAGAVAYLIKPIGFIELKEAVERALGAPR